MIRTAGSGRYKLLKFKDDKLLLLGLRTYKWVSKHNKYSLTLIKKPNSDFVFISDGYYRLYEIKDETGLKNGMHLELSVGPGLWQGYLLSNLPSPKQKTIQLIPSNEVISIPRISSIKMLKMAY